MQIRIEDDIITITCTQDTIDDLEIEAEERNL